MTWRLARSLVVLRDEVNDKYPNRDKKSDGTIGDIRHQNEGSASDHNPWITVNGIGVVRAFDIDSGPNIDAAWLAEYLRKLGKSGDQRLQNHGYVIFNKKIASASYSNWAWRSYTGSDPHTSHIHVSVSRIPKAFDSLASWGLDDNDPPDKPKPWIPNHNAGWQPGSRTIRNGNNGEDVRYLNHRFFGTIKADHFSPSLTAAIKKYQKRNHLTVDGIVGPATWKKLGVKYTGKK